MTDPRPTLSAPASGAPATTSGIRALTVDEQGHLDRARTHLRASGADLTDLQAVGTLLHATRTRWATQPGAPVPQGMVMALGVGVGDLIVARVPGSRWALRVSGDAPTPAVVSLSGDDAALPLADVATRWQTGCTPTWVSEYVTAAAAHLSFPTALEVPTPRVPTRTEPEDTRGAGAPQSAAESPAPVVTPVSVASMPLPARAVTPLPARTGAPTDDRPSAPPTSSALPERAANTLPERGAAALPTRGAAPSSVAEVAAPTSNTPLPGRPSAGAGPAGYFATAAGAFPTPHVVAPAPGPLSAGPSRPVHTSLASAFSKSRPVAAQPTPEPAPAPAPTPAPPTYRVPADLPHPPSRGAQDIALGVLEQALEVALAAEGAPSPFAVVDASPTHAVGPHRFEGDPAQALQEARAWLRGTGAARAAVVWFGPLSAQDGDAVFVEASDAGAPSLVVAHLYRPVTYSEGRTRPARAVGNPMVLGQGGPLL